MTVSLDTNESSRGTRKLFMCRAGLATAVLIVAFVTAELAAQFYAYRIAGKGKLFECDSSLGWRVKSGLALDRLNSDGESWHIATGVEGLRGAAAWKNDAKRKVLIVGDSFAFGEGVNVEQRFDTRLAAVSPDTSFINLGVMGYGTDQQILSAGQWSDSLGSGDVFLIMTSPNDFRDILRQSHSGRAKPWFELVNGKIRRREAQIGMKQQLRDKSYILARIFASMASRSSKHAAPDPSLSAQLYRGIVEEGTRRLRDDGVKIVIAYHGTEELEAFPGKTEFAVVVQKLSAVPGIESVNLDNVFHKRQIPYLQKDGHWNAEGHMIAADALRSILLSSK